VTQSKSANSAAKRPGVNHVSASVVNEAAARLVWPGGIGGEFAAIGGETQALSFIRGAGAGAYLLALRRRIHSPAGQANADMLNYIWLGLVLLAVLLGGWSHQLKEVSDAAFGAAKTAVMEIALPLIGLTALWLGVMRLAEQAGMVRALARGLRPLLRRLFPDVPADHPAMGSMLMNLAANMIGLTNAATPLGLRAMTDLEKLNRRPGAATNAMCTFLAINTSSVQLIPTTAIALLAAAHSASPTAIVGTALLATSCSTAVGIAAVKLLERLPGYRLPPQPESQPPAAAADHLAPEDAGACAAGSRGKLCAVVGTLLLIGFFAVLMVRAIHGGEASPAEPTLFLRVMNSISLLAVPFMLAFFPLYAAARGVRVYEEFVEGAKEGFHVAVRIIPYLVAMLVAVGMFRSAGGVDLLTRVLKPALDWMQFPPELLPLALTRPLSGSASIALFADLIKSLGPDHLVSRMGGTLLGSTETTLYVVAVYFGAVGVQRARHAIAAGLLADLAGIIASVVICRLVFG
jgi:spore maturation protein SpmA